MCYAVKRAGIFRRAMINDKDSPCSTGHEAIQFNGDPGSERYGLSSLFPERPFPKEPDIQRRWTSGRPFYAFLCDLFIDLRLGSAGLNSDSP